VTALLTIIHVLICIVLIMAVLLQSGKAADLAGAFGGGGSQTAFGPRSTASILSRVTQICAIMFMVTSLGLWLFSGRESSSAVKGVAAPVPAAAVPKKAETPAVKPPDAKPVEKKAGDPAPIQKTAEQKPAAAETKK
jgi:preprotein translocase subunit SecG